MRHYILILALILCTFSAYSQSWEVPQDRSDRLAPFEFTDASVSAGEAIYNLNCKSCHGDPTRGNYQPLNPIPGDPASEKIQLNSDGSLQYKISEGRVLMPSFKRVLSPDDIWNLISYIRSFNSTYTQSVSLVQKLTNVKWSVIKIALSLNHEDSQVKASLIGLEGEEWTPVPDTEVRLSAQRYFGALTLDNPKLTNSNGDVIFDVPHDLPGNESGLVELTAQLTDIDLFGEIKKDTVLNIGTASLAPSLTSERAMWNISRKAPIWLLIAYPGVVLTVWAFIFFVLMQLKKVYKLGEEE